MSDLKNVQPLADFNWDEFENGGSSEVSKQDLEKAYDETLNKVSEHQVVEGEVISVDKKEVIVNIGYKRDTYTTAYHQSRATYGSAQWWSAKTCGTC